MSTTEKPRLVDTLPSRDAVKYSGRSIRTLHRKADEGVLTKYYVGRSLRWSIAELDALLAIKAS